MLIEITFLGIRTIMKSSLSCSTFKMQFPNSVWLKMISQAQYFLFYYDKFYTLNHNRTEI